MEIFNKLIFGNNFDYDYENLPSIMYGDNTIENLKITF